MFENLCLLTEILRKNYLVTDSMIIKNLAMESVRSKFVLGVTCLICLISLSLSFLIYKMGMIIVVIIEEVCHALEIMSGTEWTFSVGNSGIDLGL